MKYPRISVVTPSFNQARYLEQTLRSVLEQGYPNLEYIVIDGASTDGSRAILERYSPRLAYCRSESDQGQSDAIAKGFRRATGEILCWLNSDDLLLPEALHRVGRYFERHSEAESVSGGAFVIDAAGLPSRTVYGSYTLGVSSTFDRFRFFGQEGVFQQATFWRRTAYEAVGGIDPKFQFAMDLDLFTRLAERRRFGCLPRMLACFRLHEDCKSMRLQEVRKSELAAYRAVYLRGEGETRTGRLRQWTYKNMNRGRKVALAAFRHAGLVKLQPVPFRD
jgi:glycosyltransferase involved in cell wall biosynthesis